MTYTTPIKGLNAKFEYADYYARDSATGKVDTQKLWVTVMYSY